MGSVVKIQPSRVKQALLVLATPHREAQAKAYIESHGGQLIGIKGDAELDLSLLDAEKHQALIFADDVSLQAVGKKAPGPVVVSFEGNTMVHRLKHGGGKGEQVAKAVGLSKVAADRVISVIDATAGLGRDSLILAALGCHVEMFERNPVVRELLLDGLDRASMSVEVMAIAGRMQLHTEDFISGSGAYEDNSVDVVYLDPMFPDRNKSALVKKEMRVFKQLIGGDEDADQLFDPAFRIAKHRVVVKRPKAAPFLAGKTPSVQIKGKSGRFDIYTKKAF
ncbi:class I SAM-dependent methyltransferase [Litoribacillus peritrichatus]|uniref:Ribosomal RNA small subunit methyltransferase J n=1 Tax=Litoribacillus peritrichatus TaxID=718191 RepID=A0ABP7N967_9GAMM